MYGGCAARLLSREQRAAHFVAFFFFRVYGMFMEKHYTFTFALQYKQFFFAFTILFFTELLAITTVE